MSTFGPNERYHMRKDIDLALSVLSLVEGVMTAVHRYDMAHVCDEDRPNINPALKSLTLACSKLEDVYMDLHERGDDEWAKERGLPAI